MLLVTAVDNAFGQAASVRFIHRFFFSLVGAGLFLLACGIYGVSGSESSIVRATQTQRLLGRPATEAAFLPQLSSGHSRLLRSPKFPVQQPQTLRITQADVLADPLELPGWRDGTKWITSDPNVQLHHWLQHIMDTREPSSDLDWAHNKTILLLGDSVLRGWVFHLCDDLVHSDKRRLTFSEDAEVNEKNEGWECVIPTTGTRFINAFIYGMTDYSRYPADSPLISKDWPKGPWGFEDRIPTIIEQYSSYDIDMIVLNSGAWDMKFMYRRDVFEGRSSEDIDPAELHDLSDRFRQCMTMIRTAWPFTKLAFLQTQPFDTDDTLNRWIWAQNLTQYGGHDWGIDFSDYITDVQSIQNISTRLPPMFTRRRVSQLATTYRRVAAEEDWDSVDLWQIAEATEPGEFYPKADPVHPSVPSIHVVLDFVLEKLWRWDVYGI